MRLEKYIENRVRAMLNNPHSTKGYKLVAEGNPCRLQDPSITPAYPVVYGNSAETQGVGDLVTDEADENYGKYRVPLVIKGKNLATGEIIGATRSLNGVLTPSSGDSALNILVEVKPMTAYTLQIFGNPYGSLRQYYYAKNAESSFISTELVSATANRITFITPDNCNYWSFQAGSRNDHWGKDWQLEEGTVGTEYETPFSETVYLYLDEPLRKIGDDADYIDWKKGIIKRFANGSPTETPITLPKLPVKPHFTNIVSVDTAVKGDLAVNYYSFTKEK